VTFAVMSIPSLILAKGFIAPQVKSGSVLTAATELGNLREPLRFAQILGIWPAGDFRVVPDDELLTYVGLMGLTIAALTGLAIALERRAGALVGYGLGALGGCLLSSRAARHGSTARPWPPPLLSFSRLGSPR
jgi:hypothetical protein